MVFVLDKNKQPLMVCHPARARKLLKAGHAAVFRRFPFTIILKNRVGGYKQPARIKIDPGSKVTGMAVTVSQKNGEAVVMGLNIEHRGEAIRASLESRRACRRGRRNRHTRYRQPRFDNRTRPEGWIPPSVQSRLLNIRTWVNRIRRLIPVKALSLENVRFDLQKLENPDISGVEYQQGTLAGFELREYLLTKHSHTCMYCEGMSNDPVLNVEHLVPRNPRSGPSGTNKLSNLGIACVTCNQLKDNMQLEEWYEVLSKSRKSIDKIRLKNVRAIQSKKNIFFKDASAVNIIRLALYDMLRSMLPLELGSGGQTKFNRTSLGYKKDHWIDAACVGESGSCVVIKENTNALNAKALGHGSRQFCRMDRYGFPRTSPKPRNMSLDGFRTGDLAKAVVVRGKKAGRYVGRIAVRSSGYFDILNKVLVTGVSSKTMTKIMCNDGYAYSIQA